MRSPTVAMAAALRADTTRPGWLVQIDFSPIVRLSSRGDATWRGYQWMGGLKLAVEGLSWSLDSTPRLIIGNPNNEILALIDNQKVADRSINIWSFDATALGDDDPIWVFSGVCDKPRAGAKEIELTLAREGVKTLDSPRLRIGPSAGFNVLMPAGSTFTVGGTTYEIERY